MADLAKIQFRRTTTAGKVPDTLSAGEIALNVNDGRIWTSDGTNNKELGLAKGGSIDGELSITGAIRFPNGAYLASQDGNLYMTKSGTTGFIDALFLRKDKSDTLNGKLTVTGDVQSNTGMFYSNDGSHYLDLGKNGDNIANWGSYNGIWNFINTNGNGTSVSINNSTISLGSNGDGTLKAGTIIFPAANAVDSNNDVSRGVQFVVESVDASSKNYPSGMGTLMTSVLSSVRVFQLYAGSGEQSLYFRTMRNDGSGSVAWNEVYTTANKPSPSDVGAYSKSEADGRFSPKANFYLSGNDAHMQGSGGGYIYANGNGNTGYYINSKTAWGFDSNGNMTSGNVPIAQGGTNANNASDARINLGFGNGTNPTYALPNRTTGKATWYKILTMGKNVKTSSGKVQFMLSGLGNYGNGLSDFSIVDVSGRSMPPVHRRSVSSNNNDVTVGYVDNGDSGWDVYVKENSGWDGNAILSVLSLSDWANQISGPITNGDFSGNNVTDTEPANITYVDPLSFGANYKNATIQTSGEFISTNKNGMRIATSNDTSNKSILLRNDGSNYNFLVSDKGVTTGENVWNTLRPFGFSVSTGKVTMGNGVVVTSGMNISDGLTSDDITASGTVNLTGDNVQVNVGKNSDLSLIKLSGTTAKVAVGYGNAFQVIQSNKAAISIGDTFTNLLSVDGNTATINSKTTNVNALNVSNDLNVSGGITVSNALKTSNLLFAGGGMPTGFIPSSQGAYLGWNDPSGRGQTVLVNHKGSGNGGFTFRNSDGKTTTAILDIDGSGNANFLGNVLSNKIIGKDNNHYLDMSTDEYRFGNYNGQFYFRNTNGNAEAQLSYSGNLKGSQWGNGWLSDYMEGRYANVTGQTFTGAVNFANNTWNKFGDDVQIGDRNVAGALCIQGINGGSTGLAFFNRDNTGNTPNSRFVSDGDNLGIYTKNGVNVHANLYVDGLGSFGGSLGASSLNISGSSYFNSSGTGNWANFANGYATGNNRTINGLRFYDSSNRADIYHWTQTGSYTGLSFHVYESNKDAYFEMRADGTLHVPNIIADGDIHTGSSSWLYTSKLQCSGEAQLGGNLHINWGGRGHSYQENGDITESEGTASIFRGFWSATSLSGALRNITNRADDSWNRTQDIYNNYVSKAYVPTAIASLGTGEIGTYGLMHSLRGSDQQVGGFFSGNELAWASAGESYYGTPGGSWKLVGYIKGNRGYDGDQVSLFIRVS